MKIGHNKKILLRIALLAAILILYTACDNLFQIGMGDKVDLTPPSNSLISPAPGVFIRDYVDFSGSVSDDQKVADVKISFNRGSTWVNTDFNQNSWSFGYDTTLVSDGRLSVMLKTTDGNGKVTTSEEYFFSIDNTPPVVMVTSPRNYDLLSYNTSVTMTVAAADVYQLTNFRVNAEAATIPDGTDPDTVDPATLTWESLSGYPLQIDQSASPLSFEFNSLPFTLNRIPAAPHRFFRFSFYAEDEAGNVSTGFFHLDDVAVINDNLTLTVDQIKDILNGNSYTNSIGTILTSADLTAIKHDASLDPILLEFDEETDLPRPGLSYPVSETADIPSMGSADSLQGYFEDDDGIDTSTMMLKIEKAVNYDYISATTDSWEIPAGLSEWNPVSDYDINMEIGVRRIDWSYPVVDLGQGIFRLSMDAQDIYGTASSVIFSRDIMISDGKPVIEISPPASQYFNNRISLSGTASHSIQITSVTLNIGYGPTSSPTWVFESLPALYDEGSSVWTFDSDLIDFSSLTPAGGLDNLTQGEILIRAFANAGSDFELKNTFLYKDTVAPTLGFDRPEANSQLNMEGLISGAADDSLSGIEDIAVLVSHTDDPQDPSTSLQWVPYNSSAVLGTDDYEFGPSLASWRYLFNTETFADGFFTFHIKAFDRAGNSSILSRAFEIYQDSDLPVISLSNVDAAGTRFDNVLSGEPGLLGSILDDDGVNPDTFKYRVKIDALTWGAWVFPYTPGEKSATSRLDFNIPLYEPGTLNTALSEGSHTVQLWVEDIYGLGLSRTAAESGGAQDLAISVDGNPPAISLSGPISGSTINDDFFISGLVTDGFGVDKVELSFDGGASYSETLYTYPGVVDPQTSYTINFPVTAGVGGLTDRTYNLRIRARDLSGSSSSENTTVIIDTTAPVIILDQPPTLDTVNESVVISGVTIEALQMNDAYWWIGTEGSAAPIYEIADPTINGWNAFLDPRNLSAVWDSYAEQDPDFTSQNYTLHLVARDLAGNWSLPFTRTVTANQESDRPGVDLTNLTLSGNGLPSPYGTAPVNLFSANGVINGSVDDDDGVDGSDILFSMRSYDWSTDSWGIWSAWNGVSSSYTGSRTLGAWSHDVSSLGEGVYQVKIRVLDKTFLGTLADTDTTADHPDLFKWNQTAPIEFAIDTDLPDVTIDSPADGDYLNASFSISGTASDANHLLVDDLGSGDTDYIFILENNGTDWSTASKVAVNSADDSWLYSVTLAGDGSDDGHKTWQVRALDRMGKVSTHEYNFTVDTSPPTTDITAFLPSVLVDDGGGGFDEHVNGIVRFDAAAGDENGIKRVKYWFLPSTDTAPTSSTFDTGGSLITAPYIEDIDTTLYSDNTFYTLYIGSEDSAGNRTLISREIYINQDSDYPMVTFSNLDDSINQSTGASSNLLESNPKVSGSVSDDDWVDSTTLEISIDGGFFEPVDFVSSSGTDVNFEHALSTYGDGIHDIQIQVYDTNDGVNDRKLGSAAVQATSSQVYLAIDQSNPVIFINPPTNTYTTGLFSMSGTAQDGNKMDQVLVSTDGGATYSSTGLLITSGAGTKSVTWTWNGDLSLKPEGLFTLKVKGIDEFSKESIADLTITVDKNGPVMFFNTPSAGETVNGPVNISGSATETYGISQIQIALDGNGDGDFADAGEIDWVTVTGTFAWSYNLDSTLLTDGNYQIYVKGTDQAGNVSADVVSRDFTVSQSSDKPVISLSTLSLAAPASDNLLPGSLQMSGTVSDDDSVDSGSIQIRIDSNNDGDYDDLGLENWANINGPPLNDANVVTWSHTFSGMTDGQYNFEIRAGDINFSGNYNDPFKSVTTGPVAFSVDTALPEGVITFPPQGAYLKDSGTGIIEISGTASDASGIKSVALSINGAAAQPAVGSTSWSYDFTIGADIQVAYQVIITDNYNKIYTLDRYFTVDTLAPVPVYNQPAAGETINGSLVVRGTTTEANLVSKVYFWMGLDGATVPDVPADPVGGDWTGEGWTNLSGTFSWSNRINTTLLTNGTYDIYVYAVDNAGNLSSPSILEDLILDQSTDNPVITINNLIANPGENLFGQGGIISGNIIDDDSVNASSIQISFDSGGSWKNVTNQGSNGTSVNWSHDLDLAAEAESATAYGVMIKASDLGDLANGIPVRTATNPLTPASSYVVGIDRYFPVLDLDNIEYVDRYNASPITITGADINGSLINNNFTITVSASDATGIKEISFSKNGGVYDDTVTNNGDGTWSYNVLIDVPGHSNDGTMSFDVKVLDEWNRAATESFALVIDTTEPTVSYLEPAEGALVNGDVTLRGSTFDVSALSSLSITGGIINAPLSPLSFTNSGTFSSWTSSFNAYDYDEAAYATDNGDGTWAFPLNVTSYDAAGNKTIAARTVHLDPEGDKPVVIAATLQPAVTESPYTGYTSVAGTIVMQSSVTDDDSPSHVLIYADLNDDGDYSDDFAWDLNADTDTTDPFETEGTPLQVSVSNGIWTTLLNENSEFGAATMAARGVASPTGYLRFYIIPYDINGIAGTPAVARVYIDANAPEVLGLNLSNGELVRGNGLTFTGTIRDDAPLNTASDIKISFDGGTTFEALPVTNTGSSPYTYTFSRSIDTTSYYADGNSGNLDISVRVTDKTFKQTNVSLSLNVDNARPAVEWNDPVTLPYTGTIPNEVYSLFGNNATVDSQNQLFGSATDSGIVSGVDKINVYFVKGGNFIRLSDGALFPEVTASVYNQSGTADSIPFTTDSQYVITIDNRLEQGQFDQTASIGDFDGFQESLKAKTGYDEWFAFFDTFLLSNGAAGDGPLDIYMVAYDEAGNTSYDSVSGQISNNPPLIPSVTVGAQTMDDSGDKVKVTGNVSFTINGTDAEGITVADFLLNVTNRYLVGTGGTLGTEDTLFTPFFYGTGGFADFDTRTPATGNDLTASAAIDIDTTAYDSGYWYLFQAQASDTDQNQVTRDFYVWINNTDSSAPAVSIDPFTQDSLDGGLSGHVESLEDRLDGDADLSGTVNITGTIYDDTNVDSLVVEISYDDGTTWSDLGTVNSFGLPLSGDALTGYTYAWSYEWNTNSLTGTADNDIQLRVRGFDGTNTTAEANRSPVTVDVVPYITDILTGFDTGLLKYGKRSAKGIYSVAAGSEITIKGYNLPGTAADSVVLGGVSFTPDSAETQLSITVDLGASLISGELSIITNGVSSINNSNDNTLAHNQEDNLFNDSLTDDRSLALWNLRSHTTLSNKTDPVMGPNAAGDGVEWLYTEGGNTLRYTNGSLNGNAYMTNGFALSGGAFDYNSDGTIMWLYLHNANWTTMTEWGWYGSVQWGRDVTTTPVENITEAYNWHRFGYPHLALGNMSFINDPSFDTALGVTLPIFNVTAEDAQLNRYEDLKLIVTGSDVETVNHAAYRDVSNSSGGLIYYAFNTGTTVGGGTDLGGTWTSDLSKVSAITNDKAYQSSGTDAQKETGLQTPIDHRGTITQDNVISFDLAVTATGTAVAVWYDGDSGNLKLAYNTAPTTNANNWIERANPVALGAGSHVAMEIDPVGGIHLAYLDSGSGYMNYTYMPGYDMIDGNIKTVLVDALLSNGQYNDIAIRAFAVDDYRPIISTFSTSFDGTKGAVRTAWPLTTIATVTDGADSEGIYSGDWEVMLVPAGVLPHSEQTYISMLNVGDDFTVGYNGTNLEEATFLGFGFFTGLY